MDPKPFSSDMLLALTEQAEDLTARRVGRREGLAEGIAVACALLEIELTAERRARMGELDVSGLEALLARSAPSAAFRSRSQLENHAYTP